MNRVAFASLTILCLLCLSSVTSLTRSAKAEGGFISINADGSVEGTVHIQTVDNVTYFFTADIDGYVEIKRDNVILDGHGYMLQGHYQSGTAAGIWLNGRTNVTIQNLYIAGHYYSIVLGGLNNTISGCRGLPDGIMLSGSNNIISRNDIESSHVTYGIVLGGDNNNVFENTMNCGISIDGSNYNNISGNNIVGGGTAILLASVYTGRIVFSSNNTISGNNIVNNGIGLEIDSTPNNTIYHNNFVNNTVQARIPYSYKNIWDNGYPFGGNYWSDYLTKYPHATEIDSSGIWNTPYVIDANNTDSYPLANKTARALPTILILSPESMIYNVTSVPLTFTVDQTTSWMGYSLDGQSKTTVSGNTTLTNLASGIHNVIIFANSTANMMGASSLIFFTVTPLDITNVSQNPTLTDVFPNDVVSVNATITDSVGMVTQVFLNYTNGNGTWITANMTNLQGNIWNSTIPNFRGDTKITYIIVASDNAGNTVTTQQLGYTFQYWVVPEFTALAIVFVFILVTLLAVLTRTKTLRALNS
jgi:parallel beta-helix repeat protein